MRLLLDTNILLRFLIEPNKLSRVAFAEISDPDNEVLFSAASIWEIAIKAALRKPNFNIAPERVLGEATAQGFEELPVRAATALQVVALPLHHGDPFDRLLVVQAMWEPALLYTADPKLKQYSELVRLV